jgi:probable F420-dependent oxidoreductase
VPRHKPFRFGAVYVSLDHWLENARKVEALGYSTLLLGDHPGMGAPSPLIALTAAAMTTSALRLGTHVLANDFHHPVLVAQAAAALDVLSQGRFELGIGSGWSRFDYDAVGVTLDAPGRRIRRLEEAVALIKRLFTEETTTFSGSFYHVQDARLSPKPIQHPHIPLMIGGGGARALTLAAREADIVSIDPRGTAAGTKDLATVTEQAIQEQLAWVRAAAGARFDRLELHMLVNVVVTHDRQAGAEQLLRAWRELPPGFFTNVERTPSELLTSPRYLIGSIDQITEQLLATREQYGISYITALDFPGQTSTIEALSPVVARLAGT